MRNFVDLDARVRGESGSEPDVAIVPETDGIVPDEDDGLPFILPRRLGVRVVWGRGQGIGRGNAPGRLVGASDAAAHERDKRTRDEQDARAKADEFTSHSSILLSDGLNQSKGDGEGAGWTSCIGAGLTPVVLGTPFLSSPSSPISITGPSVNLLPLARRPIQTS